MSRARKPDPNHPRQIAKAAGRTTYFTGVPCRNAGHIAQKSTANGGCTECQRIYHRKPAVRERQYKMQAIRRKKTIAAIKAAEALLPPKPLSPRQQAKKDGDKNYYSTSCKHGHDSTRNTASGTCNECLRIHGRKTAERLRALRPPKPKKRKLAKPRVRKPRVKKPKAKPKLRIYKEPRITVEEQKAETFDEMVARIYKEDQRW